MRQNQNSFLPENYEAPKSNSNYMKFEKGENRFRILSKPIIGWLEFDAEKKPHRYTITDKPEKPISDKPMKFFWALIVFNWFKNEVQILEITQRSIQSAIENLSKDADWGSPFDYDIKVVREGEGMETEYSVNPAPKKPITDDVRKAFEAKPIYLPALYQGADPFINHGSVTPMM